MIKDGVLHGSGSEKNHRRTGWGYPFAGRQNKEEDDLKDSVEKEREITPWLKRDCPGLRCSLLLVPGLTDVKRGSLKAVADGVKNNLTQLSELPLPFSQSCLAGLPVALTRKGYHAKTPKNSQKAVDFVAAHCPRFHGRHY